MPKIVITTEGKTENTKISIDGKEIKDLVYAELYLGYSDNISFTYTTKKKSPSGDGMASQTRFSYEPSRAAFKGEDCIDTANPQAETFCRM